MANSACFAVFEWELWGCGWRVSSGECLSSSLKVMIHRATVWAILNWKVPKQHCSRKSSRVSPPSCSVTADRLMFLTLMSSDVCSGTSGAARPSMTVCRCAKRWRASTSGPSPWTGRWATSAPESTGNDVMHYSAGSPSSNTADVCQSHISWIFMFITQSIYLFWEIIYFWACNTLFINYLLKYLCNKNVFCVCVDDSQEVKSPLLFIKCF